MIHYIYYKYRKYWNLTPLFQNQKLIPYTWLDNLLINVVILHTFI